MKAMVKASFPTTEDQENLYNQAHNAIAAEDTKNLEVLGAEDTKQRERESNQPCRPHPYTRGGYRGNRRGRRRGYDSQYQVPGRQKEKRKERERERERETTGGSHLFPNEMDYFVAQKLFQPQHTHTRKMAIKSYNAKTRIAMIFPRGLIQSDIDI